MVKGPEEVRLTRRALLRIGALAGGGLVLGIALPTHADPATAPAASRPDRVLPLPTDSPAALAPNAWIRIQGDGRIHWFWRVPRWDRAS